MRLLGNGRLITRDSGAPYFENGGVVMEGDSIVEVGEYAALLEKRSLLTPAAVLSCRD